MIKKILPSLLLSFCMLIVTCGDKENPSNQDDSFYFPEANKINTQLSSGINLGTILTGDSLTAYNENYFRWISDSGFATVRIPVRFFNHMATNKIDTVYLNQVTAVVNSAIIASLNVIICDNDTLAVPTDSNRLISVWEQLSKHFSAYSPKLVFEILNKPSFPLTPVSWNSLASQIVSRIGNSNPGRTIIVNSFDGEISNLNLISIKPDSNIILAAQFPKSFDSLSNWSATAEEKSAIDSVVKIADSLASLPLFINSFSVSPQLNTLSKIAFTSYLINSFQTKSISHAYWDFSTLYHNTASGCDTVVLRALLSPVSLQKIDSLFVH